MERYGDHERLIVNYLLGALPEAELESFERRFLEDEILFEELQEIEDELIDDYVSGALTAEQRALFEQYFLRSPQRREKLAFAREITERARAWKSEAGTSAGTSESTETASNVLPFKRWSRPVPAWRQWAAIAAAVLLAVGSGLLWLRNRRLSDQVTVAEANLTRLRQQAEAQSARAAETLAQLSAEQQQTQRLEEQLEKLQQTISTSSARKVVASIILGAEYLFRSGRGDSEKKPKTFALPANAGVVRLGMEFEKSRFEIFKITVRRAEGGTVWTRGGVKAHVVASKQSITLTIPAENLPAGNYQVILSGAPPDGPVESFGTYFIKVERKP